MGRAAPLEERFWAKVDVRGPDECWPWLGANVQGYGQIGVQQKTVLATHVSLELDGRPRPPGAYALHSCDTPSCCNPGHLRWGTQAENVADMISRGRGMHQTKPETLARGDRHGSRTKPESRARGGANGARKHPERLARGDSHYARTRPEVLARGERNGSYTKPEKRPRGERNGMTHLTADDVRAIRASKLPQSKLAAQFGITQSGVSLIVRRKNWAHVE